MAINIRSNGIGGIFIQSGIGAPAHISPIGTLFIDSSVPDGYLSNGDGTWRSIGGSGSTGFDVYVTGGTYSNGTATFMNNTGGTFSVSGFTDIYTTGATVSNSTVTFTRTDNNTYGINLSGLTLSKYLPLSGGTVSGPTIFTGGLSANTMSGDTLVLSDSILVGTNTAILSNDLASFRRDINNANWVSIANDTSGTSAKAGFLVSTDATGSPNITMQAFSPLFTTSGMRVANAGIIQSTLSAGLNLGTNGAASVTIWTNDTQRMEIDDSGYVGIGTASVSNSPITSSFATNAAVISRFINTSNGAAASSQIAVRNNSNLDALVGIRSSGFTTAGLVVANQAQYIAGAGIASVLYGTTASADTIFIYGGSALSNEIGRFTATGLTMYTGKTIVTPTVSATSITTTISSNGQAFGIFHTNSNTGNAAIAALGIDNGTSNLSFQKFGTGYTTNGLIVANSSRITAVSTNNAPLLINTQSSNAPIIFAISGVSPTNEVMRLTSTGATPGLTMYSGGVYSNTISATTYLNLPPSTFTGGTVTGPTIFTNGLTANTISATTYSNLPIDVRVTGGTTNNGDKTYTFTNNTGGTFSVTGLIDIRVTGGTYSNGTTIFTNNTGGTFSVTGLTTPFTGGTVSGPTIFTGGLSANTFSATTITASTRLDIGTTAFATTNTERLLVDDGSLGTAYSNTIIAKANTNNYAQLNIINSNSGTTASSDIVATANNGSETINYVDMGINSSGFTGAIGVANDAYLYSTGNNLLIGNTTANKSIQFFTDGTSSANTRVTVTSASTRFDVPILSGATNLMTHINNTMSYYKTLVVGGNFFAASTTAGTFLATGQLNANVRSRSTVAALIGISYVNIVSADYPTINGMTPKLRIRASLSTNGTAPGGGFTWGLYPVRVTGGTATNITFSAGTVVSGSQTTSVIAPATGTTTNVVGSDFALPADGLYVVGVVTTATTAANSIVSTVSHLQMRYT